MDPGDLVTVAGYFDKVDAETDRRVLQQAGLRSWITEEDDAAKDAVVANLQVRLEDFAAAIEILGVTLPPDSTFALESAATKCPRCGSAEIEQVDEVSDVLGASSRLFASSEREVCFYYCVSCKHRWSE
jgi:DNA-directed RNA polymerase subunit M/transcription elongation factor TFIIS